MKDALGLFLFALPIIGISAFVLYVLGLQQGGIALAICFSGTAVISVLMVTAEHLLTRGN